jgi:hypothetical protein
VTDMTITISGISLEPGQRFVIGYIDASAPNSAAPDFTAQVILARRLRARDRIT